MAVPDFDAAVGPEPVRFRFLGRDWTAHPEIPDEAVVVAAIARSCGAYAEAWPDVYAGVLADLAVRFVAYTVTEPDEWATAVRLGAPDPAAVLQVMTWLADQYQAPTAAPTASSRRTDLDGLRGALAAAGVGDDVIGT